MRLEHTNLTTAKGRYIGPRNSDLSIAIGYANAGIDEPHGHAQIRIEQETITLHAGDLMIVEPGEAHTFLSNSPDYFHIVLHTPALASIEAPHDKQLVSRARLGLAE